MYAPFLETSTSQHLAVKSDRNDWCVNVCNLEIDVDACCLTEKPDCVLSIYILIVAPFAAIVPAQSCGGHAESAATLQMSNLLPSTLPSLCSEPSHA